jgi:hypothetical protein
MAPPTEISGELLTPRVTVALEEYRALREEIVSSLGMQQTTLSFSTLALGGLALAGFRELGKDGSGELAVLLFLLVLPLVSYVALFIWLGEYARTTRAGFFLKELEERINDWVGAPALTWETYLRTPIEGKRPQYAWNAWAIFSFYAAVPLVAVAVVGFGADLGARAWLGVSVLEAAAWALIVWSFLRGEFFQALDAAAGCPSRPRVARSWGWSPRLRPS